MAGKFIKLALLIAGLFSFYLKAAPDDGSTCRAAAESSAQASPRFIGASSCSEYGSIFTGNDHCQVKAGPSSTCELDQFGVWTGSNYYFTGCLAGGECGNQPGEPDPTNPDLSGQLNPLTYITPNSSTSSDPSQWVASQTSVELAKVFRLSSLNQIQLSKNDKVINDNLLALDTKLGNVDTGLQSDLSTIKSQLTAAKTQQETDTLDIKQTITDFNDDFSQASESISTDLSSLTDQVTESFTAQTQAQEKIQEDVTTVLSSMDGLYTNFSALLTDIQVEADRDYQNFDNVQNSFNNLANRMIAYREQGYYEYNDLVNRITAISNNDPNQPCGISLGDPPCPPDDGGGGTDMTETNNLIRETIGNIQGVQSSLNNVGMYTSRISSGVDSLSWSLSDLYSINLEQLWQTEAFKTQTGEQLAAIKEALESGGTGGGSDDTETNQKLDVLADIASLIAQNTGATNDNLVQASQDIQTAVSSSGQQVTAAVDGLGEQLDGIGEGIEGINNALKAGTGQKNGPSTCEGKDCWKAASWIESSYPDGVAGLWAERKEAFDRSGMSLYLQSLIPNIGGNGGLEPFELCFQMGFANYGCHSFTIPPYVIAFIRVCLLITAGFYCQRLVFGGA